MDKLLDQLSVGLSLADDFSTQVEKKGSVIKYTLPVYIGMNLSFFEEVKEEIINMVKSENLDFSYNQFFLMASISYENENSNLAFFPSKDLIELLNQEDPDLIQFEKKITTLQEKIELFLRKKIASVPNQTRSKLTLL